MQTDRVIELHDNGMGWRLDGEDWRPTDDLYVVVGDPVIHSRSPDMHNAAIAEAGLKARYERLALPADRIPQLKDEGYRLGLRGFSVTMPYKEIVGELCDDLTDEAAAAGVVNAVRVSPEGWLGHNTDIQGIVSTLTAAGVSEGQGFVYGTGGSARAALLALHKLGLSGMTVIRRPGATASAFATWASCAKLPIREVAWQDVAGISVADEAVLVACVPGGVRVADHLPVVPGGGVFLDLRYGAHGPETLNDELWCNLDGRPVLIEQGRVAFQWWFDRPAGRRAMNDALSTR
jgi:shikimate dehydrogenase